MTINLHTMSVSTALLRRSLRANNRSESQTGTRLPSSGYGNRGWDGIPGLFGLPPALAPGYWTGGEQPGSIPSSILGRCRRFSAVDFTGTMC